MRRRVWSAAPLIESTKSGTSTRILEEQLPTSDRNFKNLVVLTPGASDLGPSGAGGGRSLGGGRTASSNRLVDGVNNNESFFGGDARGGDRLPFSYSIEAVKEIQVITAGYDVERGQFTGGTVNAVTKSGTNKFQGSVFDYERGDKRFGVKRTGRDFLDRCRAITCASSTGCHWVGPSSRTRVEEDVRPALRGPGRQHRRADHARLHPRHAAVGLSSRSRRQVARFSLC